MSNNETHFRQCRPHIGKRLKYLDRDGNVHEKLLKSIYFDDYTESYVAVFEYNNALVRFFGGPKTVPLHLVMPPPPSPVNQHNNSSSPSTSKFSKQPDTFNYYDKIYSVVDGLNFKSGDEVVWNKYSSVNEPCWGSIVLTAEREGVVPALERVALVRLETPTYKNGRVLPRQLTYKGVPNTHLIPQEELLKVEEWVIINSHEAKEIQPEDDWVTVERGKNKRKGKSKQRPNTGHFDVDPLAQIDYDLPVPSESRQRRRSTDNNTDNPIPHCSKVKASEIDWKLPIKTGQFTNAIKTQNGHGVGIQGHDNSCYMDACIFALFTFSDALDKHLLNESLENECGNILKRILRNDIVSRLRHDQYYVPYKNVRKLRKIFAEDINQQYSSRYMDVEDFLADLFKVMEVPPFLEYDNAETDYIHQIALPLTWEMEHKTDFMSLQSLLEGSLKAFEVQLQKLPDSLLIIKLPVSDGVLIPSNGVIPNITLDLKDMMLLGDFSDCTMALKAVICLRKSHFTCFVRPRSHGNSSWVFMDSKPTSQIPYVEVIPDVDQYINESLARLEIESKNVPEKSTIFSYEPKCQDFCLFQHAYVCIYEKQ